uniref:Uncharacterized protein n=1 Tax=Desulfomonile tiedjei TaxID=2358 RepID=A0A7C4EV81_9BACT
MATQRVKKTPTLKTAGPRATYTPYAADRTNQDRIAQLQIERLRQLLDMERQRSAAEQEEKQRQREQQLDRETRWRRLMQKAALAYKVGKFGAGWTWEDDAWADRLGVDLGYLKPWDRKYTVKYGR